MKPRTTCNKTFLKKLSAVSKSFPRNSLLFSPITSQIKIQHDIKNSYEPEIHWPRKKKLKRLIVCPFCILQLVSGF
ncbi:hypothetical protein L2E82_02619 [Cichorium intybus]|uniref:Uncharacterized protein n=1 Tax=Cichorium intybus TaxID=13427 RepID=A0ACB9H3R9_CICIN|nr:hypothetical protein L2E82_02619 [Cichorium intybus]